MMGEQQNEVRTVFIEALALTSPEERPRYLDAACRDKPELRQRVEALLRISERAGEILKQDALGGNLDPPESAITETAGTIIGHYRLLEQIGEGGFGVVWMADQEEPVRRRVALKIIKAGMDTREVVARFEAERQALAMMDHPNIATVYDGGATDTGRPYFVMELVKGVPITEYCDANQLSTAERLELFMQVCHAVQHAHQKGIIHRDLKPANILVTVQDDRPLPKVIDFGVAKAIEVRLTEKMLFTRLHQWVGTPVYMSPEAAGLGSLHLDTRSDIYSLGVLLYELLTGRTPFDTEKLLQAGYEAVMKTVREVDPPKPSTRLSTLSAEERTAVAAKRHADPAKLNRLVRGDLDWIVMKAIEKDRRRRYETANALVEDIQHHLNHQPVSASPPSAVYRARKFIRRHRLGVAFAAAVVMALALGLVVSLIGFAQARRERDRAVAAETDAEKQRSRAEQSARQESEQRQRAEASAEAARTDKEIAAANLQMAQINLIQHHLDDGEVGPALALLEEQRATVKMQDSRSIEWRYLWRRAHQGHRFTLRGHEGVVYAVVCLANESLVASGGADGSVRLWDMGSGLERATLVRNQSPIRCLAVSPDAKTLAWGDEDGMLTVWDLPQGHLRATVAAHNGWVRNLAFSPDSQLIATCAWDGKVKQWDAGTGKSVGPVLVFGDPDPVGPPWINAVAFSPDGQTLAYGENGAVALWGLTAGKVQARLHGHRDWIANLAFTPDGKTLVSGGNDNWVKLWDVAAARMKAELQPDVRQPACMALSPDGTAVAIGGDCGTIEVKDLASGHTKTYGHVGRVSSVAFSPDGRTLASAGDDGTVKLWDLTQEQNSPPLHGRQRLCWSVAYSPDGKTLACGGEPDPELWDVSAGRLLRIIPVGGCPCAVFSPDGKVLACGNRLWDVDSERRLPSPRLGGLAAAFSKDGETLILGGAGKLTQRSDITFLDWKTGQVGATLSGHRGWVISLAVSPDGLMVASASGGNPRNSEVMLWEIQSGRRIRTLTHGYLCVAFSPDGKTLATGSKNGGVALWDPNTGSLLKDMAGHVSYMRKLAFAPDGKTIVSCNVQGGVTFWDIEKGIERATLTRGGHAVYSTAFSPDGQTFATGGREGTLEIWRTATEAEVRAQSNCFDPRLRLARKYQADAAMLRMGLRPREAVQAYLQAESIFEELATEFPERSDYRYPRLANQINLIALVAKQDSLSGETNRWINLASDAVAAACCETNHLLASLSPALVSYFALLRSVSCQANTRNFAPVPNPVNAPRITTPVTWSNEVDRVLTQVRKVLGPEHPETVGAMNNLAWLLATCPDSKVRDGQTALRLAEEAVAATGRTNANYLDTLAAAYAEVGDFPKAVSVQQETLALPDAEHYRKGYESRLQLYQASQPSRQAVKQSTEPSR